jgi:hypothetical protein
MSCTGCGIRPAEPGMKRCAVCHEARKKDYYRRKVRVIETNRCIKCLAPSPGLVCKACNKKSNAGKAKREARNKAMGLCFCGRRPLPGKKTCEVCRQGRERRRELREDKNICERCGSQLDNIWRRRCARCRALRREELSKKREELRAVGTCIRCWNQKAKRGGVTCTKCLEKIRAHWRARRDAEHEAKLQAAANPQTDMNGPEGYPRCAQCSNRVDQRRFKRCAICRARNTLQQRKSRAKRTTLAPRERSYPMGGGPSAPTPAAPALSAPTSSGAQQPRQPEERPEPPPEERPAPPEPLPPGQGQGQREPYLAGRGSS